jgi:hypothetical protein
VYVLALGTETAAIEQVLSNARHHIEINCAPHVPYAVKGGSREGFTKSLTQKQLTRESSDGDLDGGEKDESVKARKRKAFAVALKRDLERCAAIQAVMARELDGAYASC